MTQAISFTGINLIGKSKYFKLFSGQTGGKVKGARKYKGFLKDA
jgi:hypothetical protein